MITGPTACEVYPLMYDTEIYKRPLSLDTQYDTPVIGIFLIVAAQLIHTLHVSKYLLFCNLFLQLILQFVML